MHDLQETLLFTKENSDALLADGYQLQMMEKGNWKFYKVSGPDNETALYKLVSEPYNKTIVYRGHRIA